MSWLRNLLGFTFCLWMTFRERPAFASQLGAACHDTFNYHLEKRSRKPLSKQRLDIHLVLQRSLVHDSNAPQLRMRAIGPPVVVPMQLQWVWQPLAVKDQASRAIGISVIVSHSGASLGQSDLSQTLAKQRYRLRRVKQSERSTMHVLVPAATGRSGTVNWYCSVVNLLRPKILYRTTANSP